MKPWYESRTLWVNIVSLLSALALLASTSAPITPEQAAWLVFLHAALNIVLRFLTEEPIDVEGVRNALRRFLRNEPTSPG